MPQLNIYFWLAIFLVLSTALRFVFILISSPLNPFIFFWCVLLALQAIAAVLIALHLRFRK